MKRLKGMDRELFFNKRFPQNFIIKRPLPGSIILTIISFSFLYLYRPLNPMDNKVVSYEWAMLIYCLVCGVFGFAAISLLKKTKYFSGTDQWSLLKELIFILLVILGMGFMVFFAGFVVERGSPNFFVAIRDTFLIAILPFLFFTLVNISFLFSRTRYQDANDMGQAGAEETRILIKSQLRSESLRLNPDELLYAESDGNYVIFHLEKENARLEKKSIRNSITNIERQLKSCPRFFRTHRAFLVNLQKIENKEGNASSGFRLKLKGTDNKIPVSRQNTGHFIEKYDRFFS